MSKLGTQYHEDLRELSIKTLENLGLNPFATHLLVMQYITNVSPYPATIFYEVELPGETLADKITAKNMVEITLSKPGYRGSVKQPKAGFDKGTIRLSAQAYYKYVRPNPISFLYTGIEVHFRSPGVEELDHKNIARNIFNPTV